MSAALDFIHPRDEYVSLMIVAAILAGAVASAAALLAVDRRRLGDLWWYGGIAFVLAGRVAFLAREAPRSLLDPLVAIRVQGGIVPFAGVAAVAAVGAWLARRDPPAQRLAWFAAAALGLVIATVGYDVTCIARDACAGRAAPAPLGMVMPGLTQSRLATPLIEAALLLLAGGALLMVAPPVAGAITAGGIAALLHAALAPASTRGAAALDLEAAAFAVTGVALVASAVMTWRRERREGA